MESLFELKVTTAPAGSRKIASHLFRQLKDAILDKRLPPGSRLPSTRVAQRIFGVSRNTAQGVYERLAQEGLLSAKHGSGTFVRDARADVARQCVSVKNERHGQVNPFWERPDVASWIGFWHEGSSPPRSDVLADLRPALVDQRLFPHATFRQVTARQLRRLEMNPASSRSPQRNQGNHFLRRAIAEHVGLTRAVACNADDVLVTAGAQQAFDLIARTLVIPGETIVAVEDPGYPPMRVPFAWAGARIVPVRVDAEGLVVDEIPADARVVCVCPSHQFPLGMPMSPRRREALLSFARQTGAAIVEDDYDGEFRYDGNPLDALRGAASSSHVFYVGSFSKCMFPAIRLGFLVAPGWALTALIAAKNSSDWHCPIPTQAAVAEFIRDGHLARHIRRARRIYRDRRDHLLSQLGQFPDTFSVVQSFYGMHLTVIAHDDVDCDALSYALSQRGIMVHSLSRYSLRAERRNGFILGYGAADRETLQIAVRELGAEASQSQFKVSAFDPKKRTMVSTAGRHCGVETSPHT